MTDQPTPTPRTDALAGKWAGDPDARGYREELEAFARELERELRFNEKVSKQIWSANERLKRELDEAREQLAAERALADRLAGELDRMAWLAGHEHPNSAEQALAAWKNLRNNTPQS